MYFVLPTPPPAQCRAVVRVIGPLNCGTGLSLIRVLFFRPADPPPLGAGTNQSTRRCHPYARKSTSQVVLSRMQLTRFAFGAGDVCLVGESPKHSVPALQGCEVYGHTTTVMHNNEYIPPRGRRQSGYFGYSDCGTGLCDFFFLFSVVIFRLAPLAKVVKLFRFSAFPSTHCRPASPFR